MQRSSLIEFPGRISAIIFTQGCNLRCPYCHNPELVDPVRFCPALDVEHIFEFLNKRKSILDGVVITGGEPCLQNDLLDFLTRIKSLGYLIKLDSNGTRPEVISTVIDHGLADYIAMDIKAPKMGYAKAAGIQIDPAAIEKSIGLIMTSGLDYEFRTTLARTVLSPEDLLAIGEQIRGARRYAIQHFVSSKHVDEAYHGSYSFSPDEIESIQDQLRSMVDELVIR